MGLSPKLAYPLPTTDQEVHQIRKLVCEIPAAAAEDSKLLLQTARPTTGHASAPQRADTYTDTAHPTTQSPPMPLPSRCSPRDPHTPTIARTPGPRDTGLPHPPEHQHTPATHPPAGHPSPSPTLDNPHTPAERSPAPRGTPTPSSGPPTPPAHTPEDPGPPPPAPECSPRELFPPAGANTHNLAHCRTRAQPSPEGEGHSPAPPSPAAADQICPPGRQVTTGPPQPPAPNLQPEDMPSILPAVAAAEAAARKPARITAQPASTTSSSSSASSTSSTSSSEPPLPAALILKATAKAKAAAPRTDPPTPTQATRAPRQRTGKTPDPTSAPPHLRTEVLLNLVPDPNPKPDPKPKEAPTRAHTTPQTQRHKPNRNHPNSDPHPSQDSPPTTTHAPLPPAPTTTAEVATKHDPVQALVRISVTKRPVIHPPQTTTTAGQTNPGTWDPSTTVTVKPGPQPAPPAHHIVQPQGLPTMPNPPPPQGGPENPQGVDGP